MANVCKQVDLITPEQLRAYLFHPKRVPFWNYNPSSLTFGVEAEYFVAKKGSNGRLLAKKSDFSQLIDGLKSEHGYEDRFTFDQPGRVSKNTSHGFIAVKPDFAWHILEVALPPRKTIDEIRKILSDVFQEIDYVLDSIGMERLDYSCLPALNVDYELVDTPKFRSHWPLQSSNKDDSMFALDNFAAFMASIQVHINALDESFFTLLRELYSRDLAPNQRPQRPECFDGEPIGDVRTKLYESGLGQGFLLRTVPASIPNSIEEYCHLLNESSRLFPGNDFFPVKDLSYIRPTQIGTIEFRSSGTTMDVNRIVELVEKRKEQFLNSYNILNVEMCTK